jgi:hypothetical protein
MYVRAHIRPRARRAYAGPQPAPREMLAHNLMWPCALPYCDATGKRTALRREALPAGRAARDARGERGRRSRGRRREERNDLEEGGPFLPASQRGTVQHGAAQHDTTQRVRGAPAQAGGATAAAKASAPEAKEAPKAGGAKEVRCRSGAFVAAVHAGCYSCRSCWGYSPCVIAVVRTRCLL